jgi:DNA-binding NtrC family response regulator
VLLVDDNADVLAALELLMAVHDIPTRKASTAAEALAQLGDGAVTVVLQDMNFSAGATSGDEGLSLFRTIRAQHPLVAIVLMTAWTSLEMAVALVKEGAEDYVGKPWNDELLVDRVRLALGRRRGAGSAADDGGLVAVSEPMRRVCDLATRVAASDAPVLVTGPNGSGKERVAELVHARSPRCSKTFLRVDVGALPENLLEAELFGVDAGAYTGATRAREGLFQAADGGTLLLDEIGNLPLSGQAKLLRALQTGEFRRLGSTRTMRADVRVIAVTNNDLQRAVERGAFRQDLYFRLAVIEIAVPPLRDRADDIVPLAEHFIDVFGASHALDQSALDRLVAYAWPGNVRELENRIRRGIAVSRSGVVSAEDLGFDGSDAFTETDVAGPSNEDERRAIEAVLDAHEGVVVRAAASLGVSRQALYRKMQRLGIQMVRRAKA